MSWPVVYAGLSLYSGCTSFVCTQHKSTRLCSLQQVCNCGSLSVLFCA